MGGPGRGIRHAEKPGPGLGIAADPATQSPAIAEYEQDERAYTVENRTHEADLRRCGSGRAGAKGEPPPEAARGTDVQARSVFRHHDRSPCRETAKQPMGSCLDREELAGWLGTFDQDQSGNGGDSAHWLTMYGCGICWWTARATGKSRSSY